MKSKWWLVLIILAGFLLRAYHATAISLWHDEAFSALMIRYPWGEMFYRLGIDVHPPMYYIALRLWHYVFGDAMWSLRGFSVLFGTLTIPAAYLFVKQAFTNSASSGHSRENEKMALWAALLVALNPFGTQYVTEARMYTFGAFFALLAAYFLVKALQSQKEYEDDQRLHMPNLPQDIKLKNSFIWNYVWFAVCTAIIILTHYYLLFTAAAFGLYGVYFLYSHYKFKLKNYFWFFGSWILIVIAFVPWLKTFLSQLSSVSQSYWIPDMTIWSIPGTLWAMLFSFSYDVNKISTQRLLMLAVLFTIFFLWQLLRRTDKKEKWLVVLAMAMPFIGSVLFYLKSVHCVHLSSGLSCQGRSVYMDRYFLYASMFYTVAFAAWLSQIRMKYVGPVLLGIYCLVNIAAVYNFWSDLNISQKPGMNGAAKYLGANVEPGQYVFLGTSFEFFNYKYYEQTYYHTPSSPLLYTGGRSQVSQISPVEGSALLSNADLATSYEQFAAPQSIQWVIWTYAFGAKEPTVPQNWTKIDQQEFPDVRPYNGTSIYVTEYKVN